MAGPLTALRGCRSRQAYEPKASSRSPGTLALRGWHAPHKARSRSAGFAGSRRRVIVARVDFIAETVADLVAADPAVSLAADALLAAGGGVYVVGGAVRDVALGKTPNDLDLMVTGLPEPEVERVLRALPGSLVYEGRDFRVFHYRHAASTVEVALPRTDHSTGDGHKDFESRADHTMAPADDFRRRDFTANAMGVRLPDGLFVDPFGGLDDIEAGTLRTLGPHSLIEDPLRIVRALVIKARHGLHPDATTKVQMAANAHRIPHLSAERIQIELDKIMAAADPGRAIRLAHATGVLRYVLPEVADTIGFDQNNPHHEYELGEHMIRVLERTVALTPNGDLRFADLRLAALLHDIGKPASAWTDPVTGSSHFYEHHADDGTILGAAHETVGAEMTRARMNALRYPNGRVGRVAGLVQNHMFASFSTEAGARRFLARVDSLADDLLTLRDADSHGKPDAADNDRNRALVQRVRDKHQAFSLRDLAVNGRDLLDAGVEQGPAMGEALRALMAAVIEDDSLNERATLLALAADSRP